MSDVAYVSAADETPKVRKAKAVGMPNTVRIILEENPEIPPTGLHLGHNGRGYMIRPGEPVDVPDFLVEILDHAVLLVPFTDPGTNQIVGYRERHRFPYRKL